MKVSDKKLYFSAKVRPKATSRLENCQIQFCSFISSFYLFVHLLIVFHYMSKIHFTILLLNTKYCKKSAARIMI